MNSPLFTFHFHWNLDEREEVPCWKGKVLLLTFRSSWFYYFVLLKLTFTVLMSLSRMKQFVDWNSFHLVILRRTNIRLLQFLAIIWIVEVECKFFSKSVPTLLHIISLLDSIFLLYIWGIVVTYADVCTE